MARFDTARCRTPNCDWLFHFIHVALPLMYCRMRAGTATPWVRVRLDPVFVASISSMDFLAASNCVMTSRFLGSPRNALLRGFTRARYSARAELVRRLASLLANSKSESRFLSGVISFWIFWMCSSTNSPKLQSLELHQGIRAVLTKLVARHFNLGCHEHKDVEICGINVIRPTKEKNRLIFKLRTIAPHGINERFSFT